MEYDNLRQKLHQRALYQILRRGRLRVRDFLNTKYCSRMKQRHFGGKTRWPSSFQDEFQHIVSSGNKLSNVRSFIIFHSGEGITPQFFNVTITVLTFLVNQKYNEDFPGFQFLRIIREKTFKSNLVLVLESKVLYFYISENEANFVTLTIEFYIYLDQKMTILFTSQPNINTRI